jgi:putative Mg2+ transporter-C (MgtC) family protein
LHRCKLRVAPVLRELTPVFEHTIQLLRSELGVVVSSTIIRLIVAAVLGGAIGLERQLRRKPAGLRTNLFICFGSAMFTVLSNQLAGSYGGDHTRVAAQIIPGIGFIGAGSILHSRGGVVGLTTAATLFVVAGVGMAAGGGLYLTATFATGMILVCLALLGRVEARFAMQSLLMSYEVTGQGPSAVLAEINRVLDQGHRAMHTVRVAGDPNHARVMFTVEAPVEDQDQITQLLHNSALFSSVTKLGPVEHE